MPAARNVNTAEVRLTTTSPSLSNVCRKQWPPGQVTPDVNQGLRAWRNSINHPMRFLASMPGIDQILSFIVQEGADELRLGTDDEPQALAQGVRRHFTMAKTPDPVLRHLLGELLSRDREKQLNERQAVSFFYEAHSIGAFEVRIEPRATGGLSVTFTQANRREAVPATSSSSEQSNLPSASTTFTHARVSNADEQIRMHGPVLGYTAQLQSLVDQALLRKASDIHLADGDPPYLRVDGHLTRLDNAGEVSIVELLRLDEALRDRLRSGSAVEASVNTALQQRLRITLYQSTSGLAAAIRLLPSEGPSLTDLNLPVDLASLAEIPNGLVLLCGATGSGKSTTLAALSRRALESRSIVLVTLEDPIEFRLRSSSQSVARQRQVGRDTESFSTGLRDALRSDPDVIVVGELRDPETIRLALTAAETGHLVLASIHSGSAAACVERVVDAYPAEQRPHIRVQLADALRAVVVQRLLPRQRSPGRIPALEVLRVNRAVSNVIREGKTAQIGTMLQGGRREGMLSLERCLADYVQSGSVSLDQARAAANDADSLAMYLAK